jgi:hypothetical protein
MGAWAFWAAHQWGGLVGDMPATWEQVQLYYTLAENYPEDYPVFMLHELLYTPEYGQSFGIKTGDTDGYFMQHHRAVVYYRFLHLLSLLSFNTLFGVVTWVAVLSHWGWWQVARGLARLVPLVPPLATTLVLVLCPVSWYWGGMLTREAQAIWCIGLCLWAVRQWREAPPVPLWVRAWATVCGGVGFVWLAQIRPPYAVVLAGLAVVWLATRGWWAPAVRRLGLMVCLGGLVVGGLAWPLPEVWLHHRLDELKTSRNYWALETLEQLVPTNTPPLGVEAYRILTDRTSFVYIGELDGKVANALHHLPAALASTVVRPYPWEIRKPALALPAAENLFLVAALVAVLAFWLRRHGQVPSAGGSSGDAWVVGYLALATALYLAAVGLACPFWGSLARYRCVAWPVCVLTALQLLGLWIANVQKVWQTRVRT